MKKLVLLLSVIAITFTSCNKDDDNGADQDLFIGTWTFYKYFENGIELSLEPCEAEETIVVSANGTFSNTYFEEDVDGNCEQVYAVTGTWENVGNGNYSISVDGDTTTSQINFEGNTFYVIETYTMNNETFEDKYVYIRN